MELPDCMHILANLKMVLNLTCDFILSFGPFPVYWNSAVYHELITRKCLKYLELYNQLMRTQGQH